MHFLSNRTVPYRETMRIKKINSEKGRDCTIQNPWPNQTITVYRNNKKAETVSGSSITFKTSVGEQIELKP